MKGSSRNLLVGFIAVTALAGIYFARHILVPFLMAAVIAYALHPIVSALERRGVRRAWGALLVMLALFLALAGVMAAFIPEAVRQVRQFGDRLPGYYEAVQVQLQPLTAYLQERYPQQLEAIQEKTIEGLRGFLPALAGYLAAALKSAATSVMRLIVWLLTVVVVPVLAYYLLTDFHEIRETLESLIPARARAAAQRRLDEIDRVLRSWMKAQLTVAGTLAVIYAVGLTILGVPLALLLGVIGGLANLVPYLGLVVGFVPAAILSFLDTGRWSSPVLVAGVFLLGQALEGTVISPRVMGGGLGLPPALVLMSVLVGGELFGFAGLLLAVPTTAAGLVLLRDLRRSYDEGSGARVGGPTGGPTGGQDGAARSAPLRRRRPRP